MIFSSPVTIYLTPVTIYLTSAFCLKALNNLNPILACRGRARLIGAAPPLRSACAGVAARLVFCIPPPAHVPFSRFPFSREGLRFWSPMQILCYPPRPGHAGAKTTFPPDRYAAPPSRAAPRGPGPPLPPARSAGPDHRPQHMRTVCRFTIHTTGSYCRIS